MICGIALVILFGIFNYVMAYLGSRGVRVGQIQSVTLGIFLTLLFLSECVGLYFLSGFLFGHEGYMRVVVQVLSVVFFLSFSLRVIIELVTGGISASSIGNVTRSIIAFSHRPLVGFLLAALLALLGRLFFTAIADTGAAWMNYLSVAMSTAFPVVYDALSGESEVSTGYSKPARSGWSPVLISALIFLIVGGFLSGISLFSLLTQS